MARRRLTSHLNVSWIPHGLSLLTASGGPALASDVVGDVGAAVSVGAVVSGCCGMLLFCLRCDLGAGGDRGIES